MKFLIVGGGIGGLTAALCLHKSGHEVTIFEQVSAFMDAGAGIQCGANALRVLDYLGLLNEIESVSVEPQRIDFRDGISGKTLYTTPLGETYRQQHAAPYLHVHRSHLRNMLVEAFEQNSNCQLEFKAHVTAYQERGDSVELTLEDGRTFSGDCLIGADGIKSNIRTQLLGDIAPRFTGHVAWRGVIPSNRLPKDFMEPIASNFMGTRKHMVIYYLHKQQLVNFVGVVENREWKEHSWTSRAPVRELSQDFAGWHPTVRAVIDAVNEDHCYRWALHHQKPFDNWSSARVTLLGDAAHASLPYMASGAAMAIEDARVLQRSLDKTGAIAEGLQMYQRNRQERTARVQNTSARMGSLYHLSNPLFLRLAFAGLHLVPGKRESFLPEYDANTVELI